MSETKLTPAQKRAIRHARENDGGVIYSTDYEMLQELEAAGLVEARPILTPAGWAVEVGDE